MNTVNDFEISNSLQKKLSLHMANTTKPYIIGVAGGSASGKTSVSQVIFKLIGIEDCVLISTDSYYKDLTEEDYANLSEYNFDHPNAFDFDLILEHLNKLLSGDEVKMPVYNFTHSKREDYFTIVKPCKLIIFEGILALYDKRVRNLLDMKIFVDTDSDVRLARRIYRDIKDRGRSLDNVIFRYHKFVKPAFEEFIKSTRKLADVIIPRGAENTVAIDLVAQHLKYQMSKNITDGDLKFSQLNNLSESNSQIVHKISLHEIIDPKYQFSDGRYIINENPQQIDVLHSIFEDFVNGRNFTYYSMFLDFMINNILTLYSKFTTGKSSNCYLIITELDNLTSLNIDWSKYDRIIYFQTTLLIESNFTNLENLIRSHPKCDFHVISIYLSPKFSEVLINNLTTSKIKSTINFITLFFNDSLIKYHKFIQSGGSIEMGIRDDEGDFTSQLILFKKENFVYYFRNSWKYHL